MEISTDKLNLILANKNIPISSLRAVIAPATIQKIERGESLRPQSVRRVADCLNVPVEDLLA